MLERGLLRTFDAGSYTATVQLAGSRSSVVTGVPVSRGIASGELTAGRTVALASFDPANPADAMVVGVY